MSNELGPFWVGDNPSTAFTFGLPSGVENADYESVTFTMRDASYEAVATFGPFTITDGITSVTFPPGELETPGIYTIEAKLSGPGGSITDAGTSFVVEENDGWHTLASIRTAWGTAVDLENSALYTLMDAAKEACVAFAQAFEGRPSQGFRQAQLLQTRALWQSSRADANDNIDPGAQVSVTPTDSTIRRLLRPRRAVPEFG